MNTWRMRGHQAPNPRWKLRRVVDLVHLKNGYPFPSESFLPSGSLPLVRIRDLLSSNFEVFVDPPVPVESVVGNNDVIIGMDGDFNVVVWRRGPAALNQRLCALRPRHGVDIRFIAYSLPSVLKIINDLTFATTVKHLSSSDILGERIMLPPLEEQRRIADFLDLETSRVDHLVSTRSDQMRLLDLRGRALISVTAGRLRSAYGSARLRHMTAGVGQGWSPQCDDRLAVGDEWGVLKSGCVNGGVFREEQHKALPAHIAPRTAYQIKPGDLIISRASGSPDLIGSAAIVPEGIRRLLLCDKLYRIRIDKTRCHPRFLALMLRADINREHIRLGISGAEGMANNLPISVVKDCIIPAAPLDMQYGVASQIEEELSQIDRLRTMIVQQSETLLEYRQTLIAAAVTGHFDVTTARGAEPS